MKFNAKKKNRIVNSSLNFGKKMLNGSQLKKTPIDRLNQHSYKDFSLLSDRTNEQIASSNESELQIRRIETSSGSKDDCSVHRVGQSDSFGSCSNLSQLTVKRLDSNTSESGEDNYSYNNT